MALVLIFSQAGSSVGFAQSERAFVRQVRALETQDLGLPNPAGLAFSPTAQAFHVVAARRPTQAPPPATDIVQVTPFEQRPGSARIAAAIWDPVNMVFDSHASRLLILQPEADKLIEVQEGPDGNLDPASLVRHDARSFGLWNPQGMAVDPANGHLFVLDAAGPRIVRIERDRSGAFDGTVISEIDLGGTGLGNVQGLAFDPTSGHLHVLDRTDQQLYEVTQAGQVVASRDLSGSGLVEPQGLVFAPSADLTDDPAQMNLYIADSGLVAAQPQGMEAVTAESEGEATAGKILELSFDEIPMAEAASFISNLVQIIDTSAFDPPSPDSAGITYIDATDHLLVSDSEVNEMSIYEGANLFEMTLGGNLVDTGTSTSFSREPTGVTYNPANGHVFISDDDGKEIYEIQAGDDGGYGTSDDIVTSFDTAAFNSGDPEGITFDRWQGVLFIVDGVNAEVYRVSPGANGLFDGVAPAGDDQVTSFDTLGKGISDPEGITFNSYNGNLFVVGEPSNTVAEFTTDGDLVQTIDISAADPSNAAGLAYAPGSQNPATRNLYVAARGVDNNSDPNENDGKVYEVTLPPMTNVPPLANDDAAGTVIDTPVTINVAANDTDPNGNLDPATANTACTACTGPSSGSLQNHGDGTFTYSPDAGFTGDDSFVYEICDTEDLCDTATVGITVVPSAPDMIEVRVEASADDAEEAASGAMDLDSSDLELVVYYGEPQEVGMRFNGVGIPQGATITNAYVQFKVDETKYEDPITLSIEGEAVDTAAAFTSTSGDISSRPRTTAAISWSPVRWTTVGEAGPDQRTPNLAPVLQEIVDREGWASGNSLVILITGNEGTRTAESYDGDQAGAPLLHVEYSVGPPNNPPVAGDDAYSTDEDTLLNIAAPGVLDNDGDADGDPLTAVLASGVSHGSLTLNADGSFSYTPQTNYSGPDSFSYRANDGLADSDPTTVSLTVNAVSDAPLADDDAYSTAEDTPLDVAAPGILGNDSDADGDTLSASLAGDVSHGTLTLYADGSFSYTPDADYSGLDSFTYIANDGSLDSDVATVSLTVNAVNDAPVAGDDAYSTDEDTALNVAAAGVLGNDSDAEGDTLTTVLVDDVSHGSLTLNDDGSFSYTPAADYSGPDSFTYQANDGSLDSNVATVSLTVNAVNDAPVAADDAYSTDEDTLLSVAAPGVLGNDSDADGDTLTASLVSGVGNGTLTLNDDGSFSYTPNEGFVGSDSFTYRADDGLTDSDVATVSIAVALTNDAPVAGDDAYSTDEDTELNVAAEAGILGNDSDADGDALSAVLVDNVSHGSLTLNANGSFSYTPADDYNGPDSFTYRASDGLADSNLATVSLTVNAVNDAPVAGDDSYSTDEDTVLEVDAPGVLGDDSDVDGDALSAVLVDNVSHGALTLNADGSFSYTPDVDYNGPDSFTYRANDGNLNSSLATVSLTVNAANDAPLADDDTYSTGEDTPLDVAAPGVLGNDSDADGDAVTAVLVDDVGHGTLTLNADGSFSYTPADDYNGADRFTYVANDGLANSNLATVSLTVNAVNDAPVAEDDAYSTTEDTLLNVAAPGVLGNDSDADGDALSAVLASDVGHGTLALKADGSFSYTPDGGFTGTDSFSYAANDGGLDSNVATVMLTVSPSAPEIIEVRVSASADDAEESATGDMDLTSSDLELVDYRTGLQKVGMRFSGIGIPPGATITNAYVQFQVDETKSEDPITLNIEGEAVDSATTFTDGNISSRPRTTAAISWSPVPWTTVGEAGPDQQTPDLAPVIQEIVDRGGWMSGNSLVIIITGQGTRTAESYNGDQAGAPLLHVEYSTGPSNNPPVAGDDAYSTSEDTPLSVAAPGVLGNDNDADGDALTASLASGVSHGTLTLNSNGSFSYTPEADYSGSDSFTYRANDGSLDSNVATVSLTVNAINDAPVAGDDAYSTDEDTVLEMAAPGVLGNDSDVDGDTLTASLASGVSNGTLTLNPTGSFSYTPNEGFVGSDSFTYVANDGVANSNLATVSIAVALTNDAPVAADDAYSTDEDTELNVAAEAGILGNDSDADGDTLSAVLVDNVSHGSLTLNGDGSFSYTPADDYNGPDSFTYRASDGQANSNLATVSLTVDAVNDAPVAGNDAYSTDEDTVLEMAAPGVLGNDSDVDGDTLTASLASGVSNGTLTLNPTGSFSYTPNEGFVGSDSFTYVANDGVANSNLATVSIAVALTNDAPVADDDAYSTDEDTGLNVAAEAGILGNDNDADGDTLSAVLVDNVSHGSLTLNANGSFSYTPADDYNGPDSFTYRASDGQANSNLATVSLTVNAINDAPVAGNDTGTVTQGGTLDEPAPGLLGNDSDPENDPLTVRTTPVTPPTNGILTLYADGSYTYVHDGNDTTSDSFVYEVCDSEPLCDTATVNLSITAGTVTVSFAPSDDAMVSSKKPTENYGASTSLEVRSQSRETLNSYLKFQVSGINGTIRSAKLRLYVDKSADSGGYVYAVSNDYLGTTTPWTEGGLLWGNAPSLEGAPLSTIGAVGSGAWVEFDVTAAILGDGVYSFGLGTDSSNRAAYRSKEAAEFHPVLIIEIE